ncbi:integral membrane protein [Nosema bombycis CQ1]|uniref:Integral membrane protein n=1 Tax=Nosema bombycis (strain CQ1 / CVCC 102059) TaxID=578461 RepID=R0M373_NOSB1|nr:integral membrane protein [Nosema bombycis CQ1]|eukprot:EOB12454.1 integral membrane protein [Nosema bombycis CQ1]
MVICREGCSKVDDKEGSSKAPLSTTILNITPSSLTPSTSTTPSNTPPNSPHLLIFLILFKYFFPSFFTVDFNFSLFSSFLSMDILCLLVFRPLESFFILIISNHLQFINDLPSLYILLNLSVGYSGLIKQIQSINYDIFYIFSSNPKWYEVIIPILVYSVYPRYLIFSKFKTDNYLIFDILNLLITLSSTYYFFDSMNFYFHFASRCFFVCLYFVIDLILISIK